MRNHHSRSVEATIRTSAAPEPLVEKAAEVKSDPGLTSAANLRTPRFLAELAIDNGECAAQAEVRDKLLRESLIINVQKVIDSTFRTSVVPEPPEKGAEAKSDPGLASAPNHTPAPWHCVPYDAGGQGEWHGWHIRGHYGAITMIGAASQRGPIDMETNQANARLIAACPAMYEFIKRLADEGDGDAAAIISSI